MNYNMEECGRRIRQLRIQGGLTQEELAEMLNIDRSFYGRIETGKKGCSVDVLVQLSELHHVTLDYLILGRYLRTVQGGSDMAQLKEDISELVCRLEHFKEKL